MEGISSVASRGASMSVDVLGHAGVGNQGYYDTTPPRRPDKPPPQRTRVGRGHDGDQGGHDHGGAANDPPQMISADAAAGLAEEGAMFA